MPTLTTFDGTWVNNPTADLDLYLDAGEVRRADAALFASGGIARGLGVTVSAADEVTVQPGAAVIDGDSVAAGTGVYRGGLAAIATATLDARDATYSRVDLVVLRQFDPDVVPAHTTRKQAVEVITGTPAAVPTAPALPSLAVELGRITVPASGGAAASVSTASVVSARLLGQLDIQYGTKLLSGTGVVPAGQVSATVTFARPYSVAPHMTVSMDGATGSSNNLVARSANVTTTGFTIYLYNTGASNATWTDLAVNWTARPR